MPSTLASGLATCTLAVAVLTGCSSQSSTATPAPTSAGSSTPAAAGHSRSSGTSPSSSPASPHATEFNPPGDIPDNAVFVDHTAPGTHVHFTVPEGWAQVTKGAVTTYTDKYNSVSIQVVPMRKPPTVAGVKAHEVPQLRRSVT